MPTYRAFQVADGASLRLARRELVEPAPGHARAARFHMVLDIA